MDCKEAQLLTVPHILGDLDPDSTQHREMEAHLLSCRTCSEEYESSKRVVGFIEGHKAEFAEVLGSGQDKADEQKQLEHSWQSIEAKLDKIEAPEKQARFHRTLWKLTAAACFVIGISVWLTLSNSKSPEKPTSPQVVSVSAPSIKIELLSDTGSVIIPADTQVKTTARELKTLIINGKHRMVLNSDTALSIKPVLDNEREGCMVKLASGEIFAYVEHDNNPFVVSTAHSKVVIKGTIFDVKATDSGTTLVVSEGTVQFESEKGLVQVKSGQISRITAQSAPTKPVSCDTTELTAWAARHEIITTLAKAGSSSDAYDLTDLWLSAMSGPINLESINYDDWIEKKRDWFGREFPWIFQLKEALAKEGIEVDYPELLIRSGDVWQFVYPQVSPGRIPVLNEDSLLKTASRYGFNKQRLLEDIPAAKSAFDSPVAAKKRFTGLKAFDQWAGCFEKAQKTTKELDGELLLYSLHASVYLANTRTLAWFTIKNGRSVFTAEDEAAVLDVLLMEVNTASELTNKNINLLWRSYQGQPCEEYPQLLDDAIEDIHEIMRIEERITEYESRK